jgi:hypothetical protein
MSPKTLRSSFVAVISVTWSDRRLTKDEKLLPYQPPVTIYNPTSSGRRVESQGA